MKRFLLAAGVDYEFKGVDFRKFCNNRMKRLIRANHKKDDLTFQIFDFRKGEIVTHTLTYVGGKQIETVATQAPFKPITKANYDNDHQFKDGQKGVMSILDIYKAIQQIGKTTPKTLVELSFFSHAWMGGPILVNSFDDGIMNLIVPAATSPSRFRLPSGARDPDDLDPRADKDFIAPTMNADALLDFQAAFHDDGFIWIWGCAFPRVVHEILHKLEHHPSYRNSGLREEEVFKFTNLNSEQASLLETFIGAELGQPLSGKKKIEIRFDFLKYFFCKVTVASYTHHIAKNAKVKAFGGVMGTYSEYDSGPLPLLSVYKGFTRHFTFYKNYLGFDYDLEGRKYGEYRPEFTCTAPSP